MKIDGLPIKHGDFPWQTVSHNQMVQRSWSRPTFQAFRELPSLGWQHMYPLVNCHIAIENGPVEIVDFPI